MSHRRTFSENSPPRKRHKELPLSLETQLTVTVDGYVSDGGFDGDLSSPIHHHRELESQNDTTEGSQVEVKNAEQSVMDSIHSDDISSQLPTTSQIEFTTSQQSLLNWVHSLSQAQANQEAIYREAQLKWLNNGDPGCNEYDKSSNNPCHSSMPPHSDLYVPRRSSSSFNNLGPQAPFDAKDIMLAWYQQHLDSLEGELAIHRAHLALWHRLVGTMAERANGIGAALTDAIMWGVDEIEMPPLPPEYIAFRETL
ncbi:uncharacterized protein C8R40DRAFT_1178149 [Lentinula edodes]|uniref:uncharacterized protein n=1 Tax=Lentinula edodes TaxID=5353 RepID=UPI001E8D7A1C|nr:uncharacterized protein C8R40DRAFT_1178149 [Lentinula edodes]KAH7868121.1 hypothetical protein C8R40DRAFT_1178149 [Lentinula edodes]